MVSKKKGAQKKAQEKVSEKTVSKALKSHDHVIICLMLGGFVLGFILYLFFLKVAPPDTSTAVSIENFQFLREQGEISFLLTNREDTSNACEAVVMLSLGDTQVFHESIDAGVLRPNTNKTVSLEADIPEGEFDYDIEVSCNPVAEE